MQLKLLNFKAYHTSKDGSPLTGQWGPYVRLSAQFDGYDGWASCNVKPNNPAVNWQPNSLVEIESIGMKNGYLNFTLPKASIPSQGAGQVWEKLFTKLNEFDKKLDMVLDVVRGLEMVDPGEEEKSEDSNNPPF